MVVKVSSKQTGKKYTLRDCFNILNAIQKGCKPGGTTAGGAITYASNIRWEMS